MVENVIDHRLTRGSSFWPSFHNLYNTSNGNTARAFFENSAVSQLSTGIDEIILLKFRVILKTLTKFEIDADKFDVRDTTQDARLFRLDNTRKISRTAANFDLLSMFSISSDSVIASLRKRLLKKSKPLEAGVIALLRSAPVEQTTSLGAVCQGDDVAECSGSSETSEDGSIVVEEINDSDL